jgi:hypothetical protein
MTKEYHTAELKDDGSFKIHGLEPGKYSLVIQLSDERPGSELLDTVGTKIVPVVVTAEQAGTGELNLDVIEVECRAPNQG